MINKQKSAMFLYTNNEISEIESKKKSNLKLHQLLYIDCINNKALLYGTGTIFNILL